MSKQVPSGAAPSSGTVAGMDVGVDIIGTDVLDLSTASELEITPRPRRRIVVADVQGIQVDYDSRQVDRTRVEINPGSTVNESEEPQPGAAAPEGEPDAAGTGRKIRFDRVSGRDVQIADSIYNTIRPKRDPAPPQPPVPPPGGGPPRPPASAGGLRLPTIALPLTGRGLSRQLLAGFARSTPAFGGSSPIES